MVVKDNIALNDTEHDAVDSSVTRNMQQLQAIFDTSGLRTVKQQRQAHFPQELYIVVMTALGR